MVILQYFYRLEISFVTHFVIFFDPVTEVEIRQCAQPALFDLPKDIVGAEAGAFDFGVVEGVDGGKAVVQHVDDADHAQYVVLGEFDQPAVDAALQQETRVLLMIVLIHAAANMPRGLVAQVEPVVLVEIHEREFTGAQSSVRFEAAPLAAVGGEARNRQPYWNAGLAFLAVGAVGKDAAATKSAAYEVAVDFGGDQMGWRGDLRNGLLAGQVTARVGGRVVKLQEREGKFGIVEARHRGSSSG